MESLAVDWFSMKWPSVAAKLLTPDQGDLAGIPVYLRFVMTECDWYSFKFRSN